MAFSCLKMKTRRACVCEHGDTVWFLKGEGRELELELSLKFLGRGSQG